MARRWVALLIALVLGLTACSSDAKTEVIAVRRPTTTVAPTTTSTAAPVEMAAPAPRPQRVQALPTEFTPRAPRAARPQPVKASAPRGPQSTGRIIIPRISLDHLTYEGLDIATINYGPSHWPGTAEPGNLGNATFPGHRTTYSRPFFDIDLLRNGDKVIFVNARGRFTYEVTRYFTVTPNETWIADPTEDATFTIFACHPKGSAKYRYVVKGRMIQAERTPATAGGGSGSGGSGSGGGSGGGGSEPPPPPPTTTTTTPCSICVPPV